MPLYMTITSIELETRDVYYKRPLDQVLFNFPQQKFWEKN